MTGILRLRGERMAFVGGGNMGEALIRGLLESGDVAATDVAVCDPSAARREHLATRYGVRAVALAAEMPAFPGIVVLAVKPQAVPMALEELAPAFDPRTLVVSVAAGVPTHAIESALGDETRVVRAMPNAAATVRAAATALAAGRLASSSDLALARALFDAVGRTVIVPESGLDAVTGLSGSGPGYVMLVIEALADGGVAAGLPRDVALELAAQTVLGAARLQLESGEHPAVWKDRVMSPAGTTAAGLAELESGAVRSAFARAVTRAAERSRALGAPARSSSSGER